MKKERLINPPPAVGSEGGRRPTESSNCGRRGTKALGIQAEAGSRASHAPWASLSIPFLVSWGLKIYRLEKWRDDAIVGMDTGLKTREQTPVQAELDSAMKRIGELSMENELLWNGSGQVPFTQEEIVEMSSAISDTTGFRYGIQRVWRGLGANPLHLLRTKVPSLQQREAFRIPWPQARCSRWELLDHVRAYIRNSPFAERATERCGHISDSAWTCQLEGIGVLRIMRENRLLSPYRARPAPPIEHEGTIVTEAPSVMWGTDATKIFTIDDGWVWAFIAVEHWNAECVGWHVAKKRRSFCRS